MELSPEKRKNCRKFMAVIFVFTAALCFLLMDAKLYGRFMDQPLARNGIMELSSAIPGKMTTFHLNGDWEFFPDQLIYGSTLAYEGSGQSMSVPSKCFISPFAKCEKCSYRLTIRGLTDGVIYKVYFPGLYATYNVYADGKMISDADGTPLSSTVFKCDGDTTVITVEFTDAGTGGLYMSPVLTTLDHYTGYYTSFCIANFALIFALAFVSIIFAIIFSKLKFASGFKYLFMLSYLTLLRYIAGISWLDLLYQISVYPLVPRILMTINQLLSIGCLLSCMDFTENYFGSVLTMRQSNMLKLLILAAGMCSGVFYGYAYELFIGLLMVLGIFAFCVNIINCVNAMTAGKDYALLISIMTVLLLFGNIAELLNDMGLFISDMTFILPVSQICFSLVQARLLSVRGQELFNNMEKTIEMKNKIQESESALLASQIQPHFLFNTLNAIQELCYTDPMKAAQAIVKFSTHLRSGLDFIKNQDDIPFNAEFSHIQNYFDIEQMRFGEALKFVTDIRYSDFYVPPLSIQPFVENAVRHGVCARPERGTVTLATWIDKDIITIEITDDGVGFDTKQVYNDNRVHALDNIRTRLKNSLDADVSIVSVIGKGTKVTITFSKNKGTRPKHDEASSLE